MTVTGSEPFTAAPVIGSSVRRLGESTVVINVGTELRHLELPAVEEVIAAVQSEGCSDFVFDLSYLRRYETFALVRLARHWDRLIGADCSVHVAARDARVVADLRRLAETCEWQLHASAARALRSLLSAPVS